MAEPFGFTEKEAAAQIGVTDRTLRRWRKAGAVGYLLTPGGRVRYHGEHLRRLLLDMRVDPPRSVQMSAYVRTLPAK